MLSRKRNRSLLLTVMMLFALVWSVIYIGIALIAQVTAATGSAPSDSVALPQNSHLIVNDMQAISMATPDATGVLLITQNQIQAAEGIVLSSFFIYFIIATNVSNFDLFPSQAKLNQSTRQQIYNIIQQNEGIHLREICRMMDKKMGVVQYHIYILESAKLIDSLKDGRYKRFFINHQDSPEKQLIISLLQRETTARILNLIVQNNGNGISHSAIAKELDSSSQAISWHIQKMMDSDVITVLKCGAQKYYQINPTFLPILESLL